MINSRLQEIPEERKERGRESKAKWKHSGSSSHVCIVQPPEEALGRGFGSSDNWAHERAPERGAGSSGPFPRPHCVHCSIFFFCNILHNQLVSMLSAPLICRDAPAVCLNFNCRLWELWLKASSTGKNHWSLCRAPARQVGLSPAWGLREYSRQVGLSPTCGLRGYSS